MIQVFSPSPGVTVRYARDCRFKKGALSIQFLRPMAQGENARNALLPSVWLRGCQGYPDLRSITARLDELYGASVSPMVRRVGDLQTVGLYLTFVDDRFVPEGVLSPLLELLRQVLLEPVTVQGAFDPEFVDSEKRNLISTIESERNDKRAHAASQMLRLMCQGDSFALPRLGQPEDVEAITPQSLYAQHTRLLGESPVEIFYIGSAPAETLLGLLKPLTDALAHTLTVLPPHTPFVPQVEPQSVRETTQVNQGKLSMGFTTPVTYRSPDYAAAQVFNGLFGAGMTSKLFVNVREKLSLCYYAGSGYYGSKGIFTVSSGIDETNFDTAREEILRQLSLCAQGDITPQELQAAKEGILSSLRSIPDTTGAMEGFYATASIGGAPYDLPQYQQAIQAVTVEDVVRVASGVKLHTVFFLKGDGQ